MEKPILKQTLTFPSYSTLGTLVLDKKNLITKENKNASLIGILETSVKLKIQFKLMILFLLHSTMK